MATKATQKSVERARLFGGGGNFNLLKAKLFRHKERLKKSLRERGHELPEPVFKKYNAILRALTKSYDLVGGIPCTGPFMSLDLPKSKRVSVVRRASARRRR
jgi:hypothetical protein